MSPPEVARLFEAELSRRLAEFGLDKTPPGHFRNTLSRDVFGHFGLRLFIDEETGQVGVWPIVGVRFHAVERLVCALTGREFYEYGSYTIGKPIGFLMEHFELAHWSVGSQDDIPTVGDEVVRSLENHGLPYMHSHCSLSAAVEEMSPEEFGGSHDSERLAVTYALLGEDEKSTQVLDHQLSRLKQGGFPDFGEFRRFSDSLKSRIEQDRVREA